MLLKNFYTVQKLDQQEGAQTKIVAHLQINKSHEIFQGHFPGLPIVPGVCMVQIIKELTEQNLGKKLMLQNAGNIKFLSMINPDINPEVIATVSFSEAAGKIMVDGQLHWESTTFFKIKGEFVLTA